MTRLWCSRFIQLDGGVVLQEQRGGRGGRRSLGPENDRIRLTGPRVVQLRLSW
eukprot:COSAG02_NODE_6089_length_3811_cov_79.446803_1_plen_52_part_10